MTNKKRLIVVVMTVALIFLFLAYKVFEIKFIDGPELQQKAVNQWTRELQVSAKRGNIVDRNMQDLARSANADTVVLRPAQVKEPDKLSAALAEILEMDATDIYKKATDKTKSEVWLKRQITDEQSNAIRRLNIKGVALTIDVKRYYPYGSFLTQTLGFTSVDGEGLGGLELYYNKYLAGSPGRLVQEKDRDGKEIPMGDEQYIAPVDGCTVSLTIDYVIQSFLEQALEEAMEVNSAKRVSGIVMDVNTGELLAISSKDDYDLNDPPRNDAELLNSLSRNTMITDSYELGSVVKPITLAAALNEGTVSLSSHFYCAGRLELDGGQGISCHARVPHGSLTLAQALEKSCNPAFATMGLGLKKENLYDYLYDFGMGSKTGIDFPSESTGIVRHVKYIQDADLARIAFGQSISMTPLQLTTAMAAIVNGGKLMQPYLVREITAADGSVVEKMEPTEVRQVISESTSASMRQLMRGVVSNGSGSNADVPGYRVGGKTGTAQKYDDNKQVMDGRHIASFIGFAPADAPEIVVYVMVDEPNVPVDFGSVVAAPIVGTIMKDTLKYIGVEPVFDEDDEDRQTGQVEVPDIKGMSMEAAAIELGKAGLKSDAIGTGKVGAQLPAAGEVVDKGTYVLMYSE
jgi:stage V sporulation protein D (sporulation-specific penicillin-binding protein)